MNYFETLRRVNSKGTDIKFTFYDGLKEGLFKHRFENHSFHSPRNVVSHNSYGYISDTYGVEFYSISGMSAENEPSLRVLSDIIELVREKNIEVIFFEELANEKVAQTIASETGARTDVLYTIEGMTEKEIESGIGYITKMTENLNKILEAVQ